MTRLLQIGVFDTGSTTTNLGDHIIMEAALNEIRELFPDAFLVRVPTHDSIGRGSRKMMNRSDLRFVGGTNLLTANRLSYSQWKFSLLDLFTVMPCILLGVGWHSYGGRTDRISGLIWRRALNSPFMHSVRDNYTAGRLRQIGVRNVLNTACVTMWNLSENHCSGIPSRKARHAVVTVTSYNKNPKEDLQWLELVIQRYDKVFFWPQMHADYSYLQSLVGDRVKVLAPSLSMLDQMLSSGNVDYLGTRLHGGIRGIQMGARSLILEVDNRAVEIARDTGLPTAKRGSIADIVAWIDGDRPTSLKLPLEEIAMWRGQFRDHLVHS